MKNRYFTGTLILLILLISGILIKADSQIQPAFPKFRVAIYVNCENQSHQLQVEGVIKRELRSFGDVQIVGNDIRNGLWQFRISVTLLGFKETDGNIYTYATCTNFYRKVPIEAFAPPWQEFFRETPAVYFPDGFIGTHGIQKLESLGKSVAAQFDTNYLQPVRDLRIRYSR